MSKSHLRCAIYTRKSSEEGLEQDFNSLHAQREACEAYILSQQHEGWRAVPTIYDDGGYSGGNMERPALRQLMADIALKKINVVVVYKVDRLTRSLADFAKIVELFDSQGVSFVSVTQQFNTTSSMGRLTLNVLLSFAQFEREVTGERIRDKIAASKQKGMWMGGTAPLGYIGDKRSLVIDPPNAEFVRAIYQRYIELGSLRRLKAELDRNGQTMPIRQRQSGKTYGGCAFGRANLHRMLSNPVYIGKITHHNKIFDGTHEPIINIALWDAVQAKLHQTDRTTRPVTPIDAILRGLLYDEHGNKLVPSYSQKQSKRFRYYVTEQLVTHSKSQAPNPVRLPAVELENLVIERLVMWLTDAEAIMQSIGHDPSRLQDTLGQANKFALELQTNEKQRHELIHKIIDRIVVGQEKLTFQIRPDSIAPGATKKMISYDTSVQLKRVGYAMRFIVSDPSKKGSRNNRDELLIAHLCKSYQWRHRLTTGQASSMREIAAQENVDASHVTRTVSRSFLSPDIIRSILLGTQPAHFNLKFLKQYRSLPLDWSAQRQLFGFETASNR